MHQRNEPAQESKPDERGQGALVATEARQDIDVALLVGILIRFRVLTAFGVARDG